MKKSTTLPILFTTKTPRNIFTQTCHACPVGLVIRGYEGISAYNEFQKAQILSKSLKNFIDENVRRDNPCRDNPCRDNPRVVPTPKNICIKTKG